MGRFMWTLGGDRRAASVSLATRVRLLCAGWIPQDNVFGLERFACLGVERGNENRCCS